MKFDIIVNNVPFNMFKPFKQLANQLAIEQALIISASSDYNMRQSSFENVEYYKYLGKCFPTAQIVASVVVVNPRGAKSFTVEDQQGRQQVVTRNHPIAPGNNIDDYIWAMSVLDLNLPGYTQFKAGQLNRSQAKFSATGIPTVFGMGRQGALFDESNYGASTESINDFARVSWSTVDQTQLSQLSGLGQHKIGISMNTSVGQLGKIMYIPDTMACAMGVRYLTVADQEEAEHVINYLNHPSVKRLVSVIKATVVSNSHQMLAYIPHHTQANKWILNK